MRETKSDLASFCCTKVVLCICTESYAINLYVTDRVPSGNLNNWSTSSFRNVVILSAGFLPFVKKAKKKDLYNYDRKSNLLYVTLFSARSRVQLNFLKYRRYHWVEFNSQWLEIKCSILTSLSQNMNKTNFIQYFQASHWVKSSCLWDFTLIQKLKCSLVIKWCILQNSPSLFIKIVLKYTL